MALINIKKKVEKAASKLGISEEILAACTTNPTGTVTRSMGSQLGGAIGRAIERSAGTPASSPETGMAASFPDGQCFLALTTDRLIAMDKSLMGKPSEILAEWPRADVIAMDIEKGKMASALSIAFADGTVVQVDGASGTNPGALVEHMS